MISFLKRALIRLSTLWDPRKSLAAYWSNHVQQYEEALRTNSHLKQEIVDIVLGERSRILSLFQKRLPSFSERISVVVTNNVHVEQCCVSMWKGHVYVLVSAVSIGRSSDHPKEPGLHAWEWIVLHEAYHVRNNHLPWLFYSRRAFSCASILCCSFWILNFLIPHPPLSLCYTLFYWMAWFTWCFQTFIGLMCEWRADTYATRSTDDPKVLQDVEKTLQRMTTQAKTHAPLGRLGYFIHLLLNDPHPPFFLRRWLIRKRLCALQPH